MKKQKSYSIAMIVIGLIVTLAYLISSYPHDNKTLTITWQQSLMCIIGALLTVGGLVARIEEENEKIVRLRNRVFGVCCMIYGGGMAYYAYTIALIHPYKCGPYDLLGICFVLTGLGFTIQGRLFEEKKRQ